MRLAIIALFLLCALNVRAAVVNAATPSRADVGTAYAACVDGDTLAIPAGAANWSTQLVLTKAITIQGAGVGQTFITNGLASDYLIRVTLTANKTNRCTGIQFESAGVDSAVYFTFYVDGSNTDAQRWRLDNCKFNWTLAGVAKFDTVLGVVDHNIIFKNQPGNVFHVKCSTWNGLTRGNGAWTNETPRFGTEDFLFFEDNLIATTNQTFITSVTDSQAGARYVYRYNTNLVAYVEGHGSEASYERSTHAVEIYRNYFWQSNVNQYASFFRGGNGLIWSNSVNDLTSVNAFVLEDNRASSAVFGPYNGADGRNHWDVNGSGLDAGTCSSAGTLTVSDSGKSWTVNQWVGYTVRRTSGITVSSLTRSGSTLTVDTGSAHGFSSGNMVSIYGANQQEYNSTYTVTVTDSDTFTATVSGGFAEPTTPATGTIRCHLGTHYSVITANTATQLTFKDSIYTGGFPTARLSFSAGETFEINRVTNSMDAIGRVGGTLVDTDVTPSLPSGWNNQTSFPWRQWANDLGNESPVFNAADPNIIAGRDYTNAVYVYTPYVYPHPMVSGVEPIPPADLPAAPGVQKIGGIRFTP